MIWQSNTKESKCEAIMDKEKVIDNHWFNLKTYATKLMIYTKHMSKFATIWVALYLLHSSASQFPKVRASLLTIVWRWMRRSCARCLASRAPLTNNFRQQLVCKMWCNFTPPSTLQQTGISFIDVKFFLYAFKCVFHSNYRQTGTGLWTGVARCFVVVINVAPDGNLL